jgi:hypothetical protein
VRFPADKGKDRNLLCVEVAIEFFFGRGMEGLAQQPNRKLETFPYQYGWLYV